ncbi:unnamed protein product [Linum tenue]|uniref:Uncharacterized protein n=1 Tax=Linum tenue TaxID=586396 RepID=A0AAV0RX23_9ROSI|nr:unnamed protein product [Linum tenue]
MGCCASKCKPRKPNFAAAAEEFRYVQDKLVVSQQPPIAYHHHHSNRISPIFPLSPTASSSSDSLPSFSNSSSGSSALTSKDRSFSNEFLWSCLKENPHVIYLNSIKECANKLPESPVPKQGKKQSVRGCSTATPQKRVRSSSPAPPLTRQKSFRIEEGHAGSRMVMRSPSPSRRFGNAEYLDRGIQTITGEEMFSKPIVRNRQASAASLMSPYVERGEVLKPAASSCLKRNKETCIHRITSKIDELAVAEAMARHEGQSDAVEDIDNPLISLDCFIFI